MKKLTAAIAAIVASAAAATSLAAQTVPHLPIPKDAAVVLNTGSTNAAGYRIVVTSSGQAHYIKGSTRGAGRISATVAAKFFDDLRAGMPLSHLRVEPCMKSASFGTMTFMWWRGQRSPDVSCPGEDAVAALNDDAATIAGALHLADGHMIRMLPNEPRKPIPAPSASPAPRKPRFIARAL